MNKLNKELCNLIKKEKLDDPSVLFGDYGTFEEIPLFSRWAHINFLKKYNFDKKNKILLEQAIAVVNETMINSNRMPNLDASEYFICTSVTSWDYIDELGCISPNIFVSKRKSWILPLLGFREFNSPETNMLKAYLYDLNISGKTVCVSKSYGNENDRVFIVDDFFLNKN
ncbi:TPA: hypothetical protein JGU28_004587 [Salmonella enterica]|nr:hypothetical protein [Salmonella enterica]